MSPIVRTEPTSEEARGLADVEARRRGRLNPRSGIDWLYRAYAPSVLSTLYLMVRDGEAARDLTQEVFVRAYTQVGFFDGEIAFRPWLLKVGSRLALNHVRERKRRHTREALQSGTGAIGRDPLDELLTKQVHEELHREVARLPMAYRQVVVLRYHEGLSCDEISRILDLPPGTVMSHLYRARLVLKRRTK